MLYTTVLFPFRTFKPFVHREKHLIGALEDTLRKVNRGTNKTFFLGTTDGTILGQMGIKPVIIGPGDIGVIHKENEHVSVQEYLDAIHLYLEVVMRIQ